MVVIIMVIKPTTSRKKSSFFRDTRDYQEHDAKNRLSIPSPIPEKLMAKV